jgi:hypothetical protein
MLISQNYGMLSRRLEREVVFTNLIPALLFLLEKCGPQKTDQEIITENKNQTLCRNSKYLKSRQKTKYIQYWPAHFGPGSSRFRSVHG